MESNELIIQSLVRYEIPLVGQPVRRGEDSATFIVHVIVTRDPQGRQFPAQKRLVEARMVLEAQGILLEYIPVNQKIEDAEQNLRTAMLASYGAIVRNVFLNAVGSKIDVWVESKTSLDSSQRADLKAAINEFSNANRLQAVSLRFVEDEPIPAMFETLSAIRRIAPCSCEELNGELEARGFSVPSLDWVNRRFDALRKAGLVLRLGDRRYAVTLDGLKRLGTQKGRSSPDIVRLLALARGAR